MQVDIGIKEESDIHSNDENMKQKEEEDERKPIFSPKPEPFHLQNSPQKIQIQSKDAANDTNMNLDMQMNFDIIDSPNYNCNNFLDSNAVTHFWGQSTPDFLYSRRRNSSNHSHASNISASVGSGTFPMSNMALNNAQNTNNNNFVRSAPPVTGSTMNNETNNYQNVFPNDDQQSINHNHDLQSNLMMTSNVQMQTETNGESKNNYASDVNINGDWNNFQYIQRQRQLTNAQLPPTVSDDVNMNLDFGIDSAQNEYIYHTNNVLLADEITKRWSMDSSNMMESTMNSNHNASQSAPTNTWMYGTLPNPAEMNTFLQPIFINSINEEHMTMPCIDDRSGSASTTNNKQSPAIGKRKRIDSDDSLLKKNVTDSNFEQKKYTGYPPPQSKMRINSNTFMPFSSSTIGNANISPFAPNFNSYFCVNNQQQFMNENWHTSQMFVSDIQNNMNMNMNMNVNINMNGMNNYSNIPPQTIDIPCMTEPVKKKRGRPRKDSPRYLANKLRNKNNPKVKKKKLKREKSIYDGMLKADREKLRRKQMKDGYFNLSKILHIQPTRSGSDLPDRSVIVSAACLEIRKLEKQLFEMTMVKDSQTIGNNMLRLSSGGPQM